MQILFPKQAVNERGTKRENVLLDIKDSKMVTTISALSFNSEARDDVSTVQRIEQEKRSNMDFLDQLLFIVSLQFFFFLNLTKFSEIDKR